MMQPWPLVERHLKSFPAGSLVVDVGCGNGKYLGCNPLAFCLGSDQYVLAFVVDWSYI